MRVLHGMLICKTEASTAMSRWISYYGEDYRKKKQEMVSARRRRVRVDK